MKRQLFALFSAGFVSLSFAAGCSGAATSDDASGNTEDLTATQLTGYFALSGDPNNDDWIEAISLRADGTFDANMGSDVSNLSGHHFPESGTFTIQKSGATSVLALTGAGSLPGQGVGTWEVALQGDTLHVKPQAGAKSFTMKKTKLITLTFNADQTVTQSGPLVQGAPLNVRYAASRDTCPVPAKGALWVSALGAADGGVATLVTGSFATAPTKGFVGALGFVPNGKHLAMWFQTGSSDSQGSTKCSMWDSKFGQNYHFSIAAN